MIPLEDVLSLVLGKCAAATPRPVRLAQARGLVLAEDVYAADAVPPFANTAMDGFAVRSADTASAPVTLRVVGTIAAGSAEEIDVGPGEAARIMTGAPVPAGADAIVMVERTTSDADSVTVEINVPVGNHVRSPGEDISAGALALERGTVLSAAHLGVLANIGLSQVMVYPRPRVGVLSTGDELVGDGSPLGRGQIRDSNRVALLGLIADMGAEPVDLGLVRDDLEEIKAAMSSGAQKCDALITSGGVSVGDFDFVKAALDDLSQDMRWMQVAIRPAKPFAFGSIAGTPVFGLPGNPVSSLVSFELFARTGLRSMMGHSRPQRRPVIAVAGEDFERRPDGKTYFLRVIAEWSGEGRLTLRSAGGQGSHVLTAMARANALAIVEDGDGVRAGGFVPALLLLSDELDAE